jgi:5-(carboxyamino)imidazole ribonucleotide mutase
MKMAKNEGSAQVAIVMGSDSDLPVMRDAAHALERFDIEYDMAVVSAHRTPVEMAHFAESASSRGIKVIIAGAGGAAHLPGMVAAHTELPVIGVPVPIGVMNGQDALWSIVQMPKGVPVATVAIGNAWNAGVLAAQILAVGNADLGRKLKDYKEELRKLVFQKNAALKS